MPNPATTQTRGGTAQSAGNDGARAMPVVPFIRASRLYREQFVDINRAQTASDQEVGTFDVPAYGYMRSILIQVDATDGEAGTSAALLGDAPFSALRDVYLAEPNGATIAQFNNGYQLFLANKYGGYRFHNDPRESATYGAADDGSSYSFTLRIPVELSERDGLGALPNQNSAANFKVRLTLAGSSSLVDVTPTTQPNVRIRMYLEAYDQPESETAGQVNQTTPPAMNTTQYWSVQSYNVNSGEQSIGLHRVGNYIRNLIFVFRDTDGNRAPVTNAWPDPSTLYLDTRPMDRASRTVWRNQIFERYGFNVLGDGAGQQEASVWPYDFCHEFDGHVGHENRDLWLPTLGSTRLEVQGSFSAAGTLYVLTNDVTTAGSVFL